MNQPLQSTRELAFADYFRLLVKSRFILFFSICAFLGPTWWFVTRQPDSYTTYSQLVMDDKPAFYASSAIMGPEQGGQKNIGYYRAIFQSQAFLDRLVHATAEDLAKDGAVAKLRDYVSERVSLSEGSAGAFINISSRTNSAPLSYKLVRTATDSLIAFCRRVDNEEAEKTISAIKEQMDVCIKKRDEIQLERNRKSDISNLQSMGDAAGLAALEKNYQDELVKFELDKANLEAKRSYFRSLDNAVNKPATDGNDSLLKALRAEMKALEKEKEKMLRLGIGMTPESRLNQDLAAVESRIVKLSKAGDSHQDIGLLNQWQAIRKELAASEAEMQMKRARLDAFKRAIVSYREGHPNVGQEEFELAQLDNLLARYLSTHQRLSERLEDAVIRMESKSGGLKLVDAAQMPEDPIPRRDYVFYIVSLVVGLAVGIGLGLLREFMDDTVKDPNDVEKQLHLTLLGTIPHIAPSKSDLEVTRTFTKGKKTHIRNKYPGLMTGADSEGSVVAEAYRSLRTNIVFSSPDKVVQTLLITSSGPGEGKSLTMANTALSFAQQGEPTLVIDTDLRRPVNHHLFGFDRSPGFGEMFAGTNTIDEVCREVPGTNLTVMTAGSYMPNPAELLGSRKMDTFLTELKKRYRYILFDTPPIIAVTDAAILATKLDGVVLVIRANKTSIGVSLRTLQALRNVNARVLGCILNDVDITQGSSSYGYYKHYYHNYLAKKD